jgi:hypothetical protein
MEPLNTSSPKEGAVGEQKHKMQHKKKEGWMLLKPEEVSTPA